MANANLDVIATTHARYVRGPVTDGVTTSSPFFWILKKLGHMLYNVSGTQYGPGVVRMAQHTINKWGGMDVKAIPIPRLFTNWSFNWCGYFSQWANIEWDSLENRGQEAIVNMLKETGDALVDDWSMHMNGLLFADGTSETPEGIGGLPAWMKNTGSYGGIAQTNSYWQPTVLTGSSIAGKTFESNPYAYMRRAMYSVSVKGIKPKSMRPTNRPDLAVTDQSAYEHIVNWHSIAFGQQPMAVDEELFGMGWRNFTLDGMPVYYDPLCTDATMYFLNMKDIYWVFQTGEMFKTATHKIPQPIGTEAHQTYNKSALACIDPRRCAVIGTLGV